MALTKTRWKIEPDRIVIHPNGLFFILGGLLALVYAGIFIAYRGIGQQNPIGSGTFALFLALIVVVFIMGGFTYIEFNRNTSTMRKMWLGFIPVTSIAFEKLHAVNIVTKSAGGYNYRIFSKSNKFGRGTAISSGYSKDSDKNAVAFSSEVIPLIHSYLDAADPLPAAQTTTITDYQYFTIEEGGLYKLKINKARVALLGLVFVAIGMYAFTGAGFVKDLNPIGKALVTFGPVILGLLVIAAAFTTVTFNTTTRTVERKSPIGINSMKLGFEQYINFQTVRKSYNGIYQGTDVILYFQKEAGSDKTKSLLLSTFRNTQKIERLMLEVESLLK
ncbi:hypothetical protein SAMN05421788_11095 [Filimonas lacunae]|uniref:Uncharacterized protein n=1 Tax=Filimonas lacunae TaxID=477680 RepID=A0A173MA84_9BACT|nr:hypothetical protein [Filimonas lacunae]BAV04368.1 hypothetical protein FLA_0356 [Filimonas lacunae]SIT31168.1 hypothetical protein SAMN05421788_11095 [Filimonas lacunae]